MKYCTNKDMLNLLYNGFLKKPLPLFFIKNIKNLDINFLINDCLYSVENIEFGEIEVKALTVFRGKKEDKLTLFNNKVYSEIPLFKQSDVFFNDILISIKNHFEKIFNPKFLYTLQNSGIAFNDIVFYDNTLYFLYEIFIEEPILDEYFKCQDLNTLKTFDNIDLLSKSIINNLLVRSNK